MSLLTCCQCLRCHMDSERRGEDIPFAACKSHVCPCVGRCAEPLYLYTWALQCAFTLIPHTCDQHSDIEAPHSHTINVSFRYMDLFLGALFRRKMVTLAELSSRVRAEVNSRVRRAGQALLAGAAADPWLAGRMSQDMTGEPEEDSSPAAFQLHARRNLFAGERRLMEDSSQANTMPTDAGTGRCFRTIYLCKLATRVDEDLVSAARSLRRRYGGEISAAVAMDPGNWAVLSSSETAVGGGTGVLRVVFASRQNSSTSRTLLNEAELVALCNAWMPPVPPSRRMTEASWGGWSKAQCVTRHFGSSPGGRCELRHMFRIRHVP